MPRQRNDTSLIVASIALNRVLYNRCLEKCDNITQLFELAMYAFLEETSETELKLNAILNTKRKLQEETYNSLRKKQEEKEQQKLDVWDAIDKENMHKEEIAAAVCAYVPEKSRERISRTLLTRGVQDVDDYINRIVNYIQPKFKEHDKHYLYNFVVDMIRNDWKPVLKELPPEYLAAKQEVSA